MGLLVCWVWHLEMNGNRHVSDLKSRRREGWDGDEGVFMEWRSGSEDYD